MNIFLVIIIVLQHKMKLTGCTLTQRLMKIKLQLVSLFEKTWRIQVFSGCSTNKTMLIQPFHHRHSGLLHKRYIRHHSISGNKSCVRNDSKCCPLSKTVCLRQNLDQDQDFHHFFCTYISFSLYFLFKTKKSPKKNLNRSHMT